MPLANRIRSVFKSCLLCQDDPPSVKEQELSELKQSLEDTQPVGVIVNCCRTLDQVRWEGED